MTGTTGATLAFDAVSSTNSTTDGINLAGLGTGTFTAASGTITGAAGIAFDLDGGSGDVTYPGTHQQRAGQHRRDHRPHRRHRHAERADHRHRRRRPTAGGGIAVTGNTRRHDRGQQRHQDLQHGRGPRDRHGHQRRPHAHPLRRQPRHRHHQRRRASTRTTAARIIVTGAGNTIDSTTGTALNVTNTDIGTGGATFQRISPATTPPRTPTRPTASCSTTPARPAG